MKLSKTQLEVLKALGQEGSFLHFMPYMGNFRPNPYYFLNLDMRHIRFNTVEALTTKGLVKSATDGRDKIFITEEGKKFLEENKNG